MKDLNETTEPKTSPELANQDERLVMPEYSQGCCNDGAAILRDGKQLTIEEILYGLREGEKATKILLSANSALLKINNICWEKGGINNPEINKHKVLLILEEQEEEYEQIIKAHPPIF